MFYNLQIQILKFILFSYIIIKLFKGLLIKILSVKLNLFI